MWEILSEKRKVLLNRKVIALILAIAIVIPPAVLVHAELSYGSQSSEPTYTVRVESLQDLWYPSEGTWQPNPIFINGNASSYYSRPFLMYPIKIEFEILVKDTENLTADLSWLSVSDYDIISNGTFINVTLVPLVSGNYGDNEGYLANRSESTVWQSKGLPTISTSTGVGISSHDINMTGFSYSFMSDYYRLCKVEILFGLDTRLLSVDWGILLEIAILRNEASQIAGHLMIILVTYTITWIPILVTVLPGNIMRSGMLYRGEGLADEGVEDYEFYMLEGDIAINRGHI
ncbi:MAG: hypothetical protein ACFFDV_09300 [Candidatus Thorarchaeota archaeon]